MGNDIVKFRRECVDIGKRWLPTCNIHVEEMDHGFHVGVVIETHWGARQGVRGILRDRWSKPRWWQFWKKPKLIKGLTPREAVAKLAEWAIRNEPENG